VEAQNAERKLLAHALQYRYQVILADGLYTTHYLPFGRCIDSIDVVNPGWLNSDFIRTLPSRRMASQAEPSPLW
jgi:hypothetical protein